MRTELQRLMWEALIVEKDAASLARAAAAIADQRQQLRTDLRIDRPLDYALAFEQRNLLDVADVIVGAATLRTESRGSHYRSDYPQRDDANWLTNIFTVRQNGRLQLWREWVCQSRGWEDRPGDVRIKPWA